MTRRSKSSARWLNEHESDPFVRRARVEGWRSRAVYKLEEIQARDKILKPGMRCVDLGAAPGSWTQLAARVGGPKAMIVASDVLPMDPMPGVQFVQGDFTEIAVVERILAAAGAPKIDLVLSDMAPNMAGVNSIDQPRAAYLAELALDFADQVLVSGGDLILKLFQGEGFDALVRRARGSYRKVALKKPKASRPRSSEVYLLARQFGMV